MLTAHCSLLAAHCSLLTAHCSLLTGFTRGELLGALFQLIGRHVERLRSGRNVAVGLAHGVANPVLQLPLLDRPVKRSLADAEHLRGLVAVPFGHFQRPFGVVALDFGEWPTDEMVGSRRD